MHAGHRLVAARLIAKIRCAKRDRDVSRQHSEQIKLVLSECAPFEAAELQHPDHRARQLQRYRDKRLRLDRQSRYGLELWVRSDVIHAHRLRSFSHDTQDARTQPAAPLPQHVGVGIADDDWA